MLAVGAGVVLVQEDVDPDAGRPEGRGQGVHLGKGLVGRLVVGLTGRDVGLEGVVGCGCRVGLESVGADEDDRGRGLSTHVRRR